MNVADNRKQWKKERNNLSKEKNVVPVAISDVRSSSINEAMHSKSASSSSHSVTSDPSTVKNLQRNIFQSGGEELLRLLLATNLH